MKDIQESDAPGNAEAAGDPDEEEALRFLEALVSDAGVFTLTEISLGREVASRMGELPKHRGEALDYLRQRAGAVNLYYMPNATKPKAEWKGRSETSPATKASKADVIDLRAAWVDLDPEGGADEFGAERARLLEIVEGAKAHPACPPSAVIDSGNGFQLVWFFAEWIEATPETIAAAEAQNRALARLFGGDHTHDVSRVLRLPGTWNLPDAGKRAKGRVKRPTRLLHLDATARYTLDDLAELAAPGAVNDAINGREIDLEGFDYAAVEEVLGQEEGLPEHLRQFVDTHREAIERTKKNNDDDNSDRDFGVLGICIQHGISDPTEAYMVVAAVTPGALDARGDDAERYARVTIRKALRKIRPFPYTHIGDFFSPITSEDLAQVPVAAIPERPRGLVGRAFSGTSDPKRIPRRESLLSPRLAPGLVVQCVGPPGMSKSTFALREALIVGHGRHDLLMPGERLFGTGPVIVYNAEDPLDEMERRITAAHRYYGPGPLQRPHEIRLVSGTERRLSIVRRSEARGRQGPLVRALGEGTALGADDLENLIREMGAKLVILDPQVDLARGANENDNDDINALLQELTQIATRNRVCIVVVHHTSKQGRDSIGDLGAGRGASAAAGKVRGAFTMMPVVGRNDEEHAWLKAYPRAKLVRLDYSKVQYGPVPTEPNVYRILEAPVGNGEAGEPKDTVALFDGDDAVEALRLRGDYAPVLELVDHRGLVERTAAEANPRDEAKAQAVARIILRMMDGKPKVDLADIWAGCGECLRDEGIMTAKGRNHVTGTITASLTGGVVLNQEGQSVRVSISKFGAERNAPWILTAESVDGS